MTANLSRKSSLLKGIRKDEVHFQQSHWLLERLQGHGQLLADMLELSTNTGAQVYTNIEPDIHRK